MIKIFCTLNLIFHLIRHSLKIWGMLMIWKLLTFGDQLQRWTICKLYILWLKTLILIINIINKINIIFRDKRGIYPYTTTSTTPTTEPYIVITVSWDLSLIDFPICLAKVVFTYYNIGELYEKLSSSTQLWNTFLSGVWII